MSGRRARVLVIDDSPGSRRFLVEQLEAEGDLEVVGRAADGTAGLRLLLELRPDVVTLDLELPGLDGFSLLRLVMAEAPTPVVVISSYAHPADTSRALALGAVGLLAKPQLPDAERSAAFGRELRESIRRALGTRTADLTKGGVPEPAEPLVVGLGASTGGPAAIQRLLQGWSRIPGLSVLICQHMPAHFTGDFAARLHRLGGLAVEEAREGAPLRAGCAWVAPGGRQLELVRGQGGLRLSTPPRHPEERHAPSVDRLFCSLARALGPEGLGLVLTGMGGDGAAGALALKAAGGQVWAESEETSVVHGMPQEAIATGAVSRVLPLGQLGLAVASLARARRERLGGRRPPRP